jgi:hypothetical protein
MRRLPLGPVAAWEVKTDGTERVGVGKTSAQLLAARDPPHTLRFCGNLACLPGERAGRFVGFARTAMPASAPPSRGVALLATAGDAASAQLVFAILVDVEPVDLGPVYGPLAAQPGRRITYQADFQVPATGGPHRVEVLWEQFRPNSRGQTLDAAPQLTSAMVAGLGVAILRSRQQVPPLANSSNRFDLALGPHWEFLP